jgi:predicted Zn-ribbon and HTH transcriptional regulator
MNTNKAKIFYYRIIELLNPNEKRKEISADNIVAFKFNNESPDITIHMNKFDNTLKITTDGKLIIHPIVCNCIYIESRRI